jgi:amidohydrolase
MDYRQRANAMRDELIARRRDFHRHPELAFEEIRTAGIVANELRDLGLEVQMGVGQTGVVGILEGAQAGPTVLVRADMDALPVQEANRTDYDSMVAGKMHACGHDGHTTIALAVARLLSEQRDEMAGRVKFVFQPAEEIGRGAKAMIKDGVLQDPKPDVSLGLHLWNSLPLGVLGVADGPIMAGSSNFDIKITGKGGHAALPHLNIDPVVCAAQVVTALQTIVSRSLDPFGTAVLTVTYIRAGDAYNVIPQDVLLRGTFRAFVPEVRELVEKRLREITESVCKGMGCTAEISVVYDTAPVVNDPEVTARMRDIFEPMVGTDNLDTGVRTMGAEDVGAYMTDIPGMYIFVGAQDASADAYYGHHHPKFSFDEEALPLAVALMTSAVASYVLPD